MLPSPSHVGNENECRYKIDTTQNKLNLLIKIILYFQRELRHWQYLIISSQISFWSFGALLSATINVEIMYFLARKWNEKIFGSMYASENDYHREKYKIVVKIFRMISETYALQKEKNAIITMLLLLSTKTFIHVIQLIATTRIYCVRIQTRWTNFFSAMIRNCSHIHDVYRIKIK